MTNVVPLRKPYHFTDNPNGELLIYPVTDDGGTWAVDHISRSGNSVARIGRWSHLHEAEDEARAYAMRTGCDFPQSGRRA